MMLMLSTLEGNAKVIMNQFNLRVGFLISIGRTWVVQSSPSAYHSGKRLAVTVMLTTFTC